MLIKFFWKNLKNKSMICGIHHFTLHYITLHYITKFKTKIDVIPRSRFKIGQRRCNACTTLNNITSTHHVCWVVDPLNIACGYPFWTIYFPLIWRWCFRHLTFLVAMAMHSFQLNEKFSSVNLILSMPSLNHSYQRFCIVILHFHVLLTLHHFVYIDISFALYVLLCHQV